jgi:inorganic pyrophosphatase
MEFEIVVETPKGSRNKYEMDHRINRIRLDRCLFTATAYPFDYGYVDGTLAEDGEPLDAMVLGEEPTFPGCVIPVRPVAVFWMHDEQGPDAKVLTVPGHDPRFMHIQDLPDVPSYMRNEIGHFFEVYKDLEPGKSTDTRGWEDRTSAESIIEAATRRLTSPG